MAGSITKHTKRIKSWSMYPSHHRSVAEDLRESDLMFSFHNLDDDAACLKSYDTNIMGRFNCRNDACTSNGWSSKKIAITIRMYAGDRYNARVYHQRCRSCRKLSKPLLDESYTERIVYRIRRWRGLDVEQPTYSAGNNRPHESHLCEGCRLGRCTNSG